MKYVNKIIALIAVFGLSFYGITYSGDLGVDEIKVIDNETLSVTLSENPNLNVGEIDGEITILNDVKLRGGFVSQDDAYKVELLLETPMKADTTYSLLTVSGSDGSIDFTTGESVDGFSATNIASTDDQDIDSIELLDDRTIMIEYRQELTSSILEYKLLAESKVVKIEKLDYYLPELTITVEPPFISEQDYILMFIDMQDVEGNYLEFDTGIYDFTTPVLDTPIIEEDMETASGSMNMQDSTPVDDMLEVVEINTESDNMADNLDLEAAGDEISLEKDAESQLDVQTVAGNMTETPDTGAQTWVLVLITLVINSFYYLSRRKQKAITA